MAARMGCHGAPCTVATLALLVGWAIMGPAVGAQAADTPRRGGVLLAVIGAEPPSLDPHQEGTFANIQLVAPFYSNLLQFDPLDFSKIISDLATEWRIAPDGLTYTFKIHQGVRFHDGSPLTAADVKASYDKIMAPRRESGASGRAASRWSSGWRLPIPAPWSSG